ncbi:MAG TPA: class I SAM-dependent methyltransferase [Candidatus Dormibacteraeota bacterium]|nr:class I SAM-dependent methyltransferase [Candidatus Dormibacteraeota bacterium]
MQEALKEESEKLARSWMQHEPAWLRDYLVSSVEDPRINFQSILSRHFLIRAFSGDRFASLMREEGRFSAVMSWLSGLLRHGESDPEEILCVHHALKIGADNCEGLEIPFFVRQAYKTLPMDAAGMTIPNYIEAFLLEDDSALETNSAFRGQQTFQHIWSRTLRDFKRDAPALSVLEPACGSANDYRFLHAYGLVPYLDYTGFDLCDKNVANARELFPEGRFQSGNVFEIEAADRSYDLCLVHDLFEHLSFAGMEQAVQEVCRVTRKGLCIGFFQMEEIAGHVLRPRDDYHWNLLSMRRMRELFGRHGFEGQIIHIGTYLRDEYRCTQTHNPNAYTFYLWRK